VGLSAEEFQKLAYGARQSGMENEALSAALIKLQKTAGDSPDTFAKLGIAVKDANGNFRSTTDILGDVAESVKNTQNPIEKTNILMAVFGKSGADLKDMLSGGRQGLKDFSDEAQRLGIVLSDDSISQFDQLGDTVDSIKESFGGFTTQAASDLVPVFNTVADAVKGALEWFHQMPAPLRQVITVSGAVAAGVALIGGACLTAVPAVWSLIAPFAPFIAAAAGVAAVAVLISQNWNACLAFLRVVWDKLQAAGQIAFSAIKMYFLTQMNAIMIGIQALFGWMPGIGEKIKAATKSIGDQLKAEASNIKENTDKLLHQNNYDKYYKELESKIKQKTEIIKQEETQATQVVTEEEQKRIDAAQQAAQKKLDFEKSNNQRLLQQNIAALDRIAGDEKKSAAERLKAAKDAAALRLKQLEDEKQEELQKAEELGADKQAILDSYALKEQEVNDNLQKSHQDAYAGMYSTLQDYIGAVAAGGDTLKDMLKNNILTELNAMEAPMIAHIMKGVADAWAQAPWTFGASLSWLPMLFSAQGAGIAAIEAAKGLIGGLAEGGLAEKPILTLVGEGKDREAVLPLNPNVYAELAKGIIGQLPKANGQAVQSTLNPTIPQRTNVINLNIGTLVADDLGLKKLSRELERIGNIEQSRRGH
jgi:hypothetical protein